MILFKYKNRAKAILNKHPLVIDFWYESGEREIEIDDVGNTELFEHERIWVSLRKGFFFGTSDVSFEWSFDLEQLKNDLSTIYFYGFSESSGSGEPEYIKWEDKK